MKQFSPLQKKIIIAGALIQLITVWFSVGFHHPDEHWQILEFANYKLGIFTHGSIPWELRRQMRSAFMPLFVYLFRKVLFAVHLTDPFVTALLLRLLTSALSFVFCIIMLRYSFRYLKTEFGRNMAVLFTFFLWFMPYLHCRFSSEIFGGMFFFSGLLLIIPWEEGAKRDTKNFLAAGLLFGASFLCRFQMAFAIVGALAWLFFIAKINWKKWGLLAMGGLVMVAVGLLIDRWFYGNFVFTPYCYYQANIVEGLSKEFGTEPFWYYLTYFIAATSPPVGIPLLACVLLSLFYFPKHPFTWVTISFILAHSAVDHKEIRFLFPLIYPLPLMATLFMNRIDAFKYVKLNRVTKAAAYIVVGTNLVILFVMTFIAANETIPFYKDIYRLAAGKSMVIYSIKESPYQYGQVESRYYRPDNLKIVTVKDISDIVPDSIPADGKEYYFADNHFQLDKNKISSHVSYECVSRSIPEWLGTFNFTDWISRARVWNLYRLKKTAPNS